MSLSPIRICGAPISWGVSEAPGWGHEMAPDRVLSEMRGLGLTATEIGPTGYLGTGPEQVRECVDRHGLRVVGGFLPVVMHLAEDISAAEDPMRTLAACGAQVVVLAARSADGSYDRKVVLGDAQWQVLLDNLKRLQDLAAAYGLLAALHPHIGTAIEDRTAVLRLLESSDIPLCVDTGHLVIGGTDPLELFRAAGERVAHVHLKDVRLSVARAASGGDTSYIDMVRSGLYVPLGDGGLDIAGMVGALESAGYRGWYVLEQDVALDREPEPGAGPAQDVRRSIDYLEGLS